MRLLLAVFILVGVHGYEVEKIEGIEGSVWQIEFDQYSNSYLQVIYNDSYFFYKLDKDNNIIFKEELPDEYPYLVPSNTGDVYVFANDSSNSEGTRTILIYKSNSTKLELLLKYNGQQCTDKKNFIDKSGNLYVNHADGVTVLKPGSNNLTAVTNLNNVKYCTQGEDEEGNVYISNQERSLWIITKEASESPVPFAEKVPEFTPDLVGVLQGYDNSVFAVSDSPDDLLTIWKLNKTSSVALYSKYNGFYNNFLTGKHKFFMEIGDFESGARYIYRFSSDGKVTQSENALEVRTNTHGAILADKDDNAYYAYSNQSAEGEYTVGIYRIGNDENKIEYLNFTTDNSIDQLAADEEGNIWILSNGLYVYLNSFGGVVQVSDLPLTGPNENDRRLKYKKDTKELIIGAEDGLYKLNLL